MRARWCFFFFQAEDGIRDYKVTGVQTCALPICDRCDDPLRRLRAYPAQRVRQESMADLGRCGAHCAHATDRKSTRLNSSHLVISYAVFCLKKKNVNRPAARQPITFADPSSPS